MSTDPATARPTPVTPVTPVTPAPASHPASRPLVAPALAAAAWGAFVWVTRIRNALGDRKLHGTSLAAPLVLSGVMLLIAAATGWIGWRARSAAADRRSVAALRLGAAVTIGVWVVRGIAIAAADHPAGFIAVHEVLAAVSIGLALWLLRATRSARVRTGR